MQSIKNRVSYGCFRVIRWLIWLFSPKFKVAGGENIPDHPCILVGNHCHMYGPICGEIYIPGKRKIWCAGQMMHLKEVPDYAFEDFWSGKPKYIRWFYRVLSYIIAPFSVCIFNNAATIPVYHDTRLLTTFKQTISSMQAGSNIVIFPECYTPHNHIVNSFQDKFVDVARLYWKRTNQAVQFVPMYIAPKLKTIYLGKPVTYQPDELMEQERERICKYLMEAITELAVALPPHRVVPYANIPKSQYPMSTSNEVKSL